MNCRDSAEMIESYLVNGIDPMQDKHLADHINSCPKCRDELAFLLKYRVIMKQVKPVSPPESFMSELHKKIEAENKKSVITRLSAVWSSFRSGTRFPVEAAGVLAVAAVILIVYRPFFENRTAEISVTESARTSKQISVQKKTAQDKTPSAVDEKKLIDAEADRSNDKSSEMIADDKMKVKDADEKKSGSIPAVKSDSAGAVDNGKKVQAESEKSSVMKREESVAADSIVSKEAPGVKKSSRRAADPGAEKIFSEHNASVVFRELTDDGRVHYRVKVETLRRSSLINKLKEKYSVEEKILNIGEKVSEVEFFLGNK